MFDCLSLNGEINLIVEIDYDLNNRQYCSNKSVFHNLLIQILKMPLYISCGND